MTEKFRDIPGYEGYYMVSPSGRVLSVSTGTIRKPYKNPKDGYWRVTLYRDGDRNTIEIHKLVATAWLPKPEEEGKWEIDHLDGDKDNNTIGNLEWVSHQENVRRA